MFLFGALPVFMAYIMVGYTILWENKKFESLFGVGYALFSLMFGDIVLETLYE
jgi:hypothetical protein